MVVRFKVVGGDWEEGILEGKSNAYPEHDVVELKSSVADDHKNNEI